jgi:hypothetical protein
LAPVVAGHSDNGAASCWGISPISSFSQKLWITLWAECNENKQPLFGQSLILAGIYFKLSFPDEKTIGYKIRQKSGNVVADLKTV